MRRVMLAADVPVGCSRSARGRRSVVRLAGLSAVLLAVAVPGVAGAAVSISAPGGLVTVTGDDQDDIVRVAVVDDGVGKRTFVIFTSPGATVSAPCTQEVGLGFGHRCQFVGMPTELHATLGEGNDRLAKETLAFPPPASNPQWNLTGDVGGGNDVVQLGKQGQDSVAGGAGQDSVDYSQCQDCTSALTIDLAGAGSSDQLSGFEDANGSFAGPNTITGTDAPNTLGGGQQADTLTGLGGSDLLNGNGGPDTLDGGAGTDAFSAGDGDDTVIAADGVSEGIRCGLGNDTAIVDATDQVFTPPDPDACENVEIAGGPPAITSGPSGVVALASALFEFAVLAGPPPPGRFECSLDGGAFTPCSSPLALTGLASGPHVFKVRYHPDGEAPGIAAERSWTVDTSPPVVAFDAAPSGGGNAPDVTVAFSANEPASFACSLDGAPVFDCTSPQQLRGLAAGLHSFTIEATDAAGNVSSQMRAEWEVVVPATPPPAAVTCPPGKQDKVAFGVIVAVARASDGCFDRESVDGRQALVSRGAVSVNGVRLSPQGNTRIVVDPALIGGVVRATGRVTVSPGDLQLGWTIAEGFTLDGLAQGQVNLLNRLLPLNESVLELAGMPVTGALTLDLSADNGGQTKLTARIAIPRATFQSLPGVSPAGQGLTVEVPITVSNDRGLTGGIRLKLAEANLFGRVKIKDLDLFYDHTTQVFEGSAGVKLTENAPAGRAEPTFTVGLAIGAGGLIGPLRKLFFQASSLNRHAGYGVFVQRFGGALESATDPDGRPLARFTGAAGLSLGPRVRLGSVELEALSLDGSLTLDVPTGPSPPELFSVTQSGSLKVVDVPLVNARVRYVPPARVEVAANVDYTLFGYGIAAELAADAQGRPLSWVSPDGFSLEARGQASLPGLGGTDPAQAVFSTNGWAVCIGPAGDRVGFGRRWGGSLNAMSDSCDVGPYRVGAAPAQAGAARSTEIPPGARLAVLTARGGSAAPKVTITGPGGERIETPAGPQGVRTGRSLLIQDALAKATHVVLRRPAAGRWTVTTQPGSPPMSRLQVAEALPAVRVSARVSGKARQRTLSWQSDALPFGQRLAFVERGAQGAHVLGATTRRRGRLAFTPDPGLGPRRVIEVTVSRRGIPRLTRVVARYSASQPALRRVGGIRLRGRTLTWRAQPAAASYALAVTLPGGATTSHRTKRPRLVLRGRVPRGNVTVSIVAVDSQGRSSRATTARLRATSS